MDEKELKQCEKEYQQAVDDTSSMGTFRVEMWCGDWGKKLITTLEASRAELVEARDKINDYEHEIEVLEEADFADRKYREEIRDDFRKQLAEAISANIELNGIIKDQDATIAEARSECKRLRKWNKQNTECPNCAVELDVYLQNGRINGVVCEGDEEPIGSREVKTYDK